MANDIGTEDKLDWLLRQLRIRRRRTPVVTDQVDVQPEVEKVEKVEVNVEVEPKVEKEEPETVSEFEEARREFQEILDQLKLDGITLTGALGRTYGQANMAIETPVKDMVAAGKTATEKVGQFKLAVENVRKEASFWNDVKDDLGETKADLVDLTTKKDPEAPALEKRLKTVETRVAGGSFKSAADEFVKVRQEAKDLLAFYPGRAAWSDMSEALAEVEKEVNLFTRVHPATAKDWADRLQGVRDKAGSHDYENAASDLKKLHEDLNSEEENPYGKVCAAAFKDASDRFNVLDEWIQSGKAGEPVDKAIEKAHVSMEAAFKSLGLVVDQAKEDGNYEPVTNPLGAFGFILSNFEKNRSAPLNLMTDRLNAITARGQNVRDKFVTDKLYGDPLPVEFTGLVKNFTDLEADALRVLNSSKQDFDITAAQSEMGGVETALKTLEKSAGGLAVKALKGGALTTKKSVRKGIMDQFVTDPNVLKVMAQSEEGVKLLDELVNNLGTKVAESDKQFVKEALIAKYGLTKLDGQLGKKSLPQLYKVLGMVPLTHTRDNKFLGEITRDKKEGQKDGGETSNYKDKKITLNLDGVSVGKAQLDCDDDVPKKHRATKTEINYFNHTTLHELGHALDDKLKFMDGKAGNATFGGWTKHSDVGTIADAIGDDTSRDNGFYESFSAKIPAAALRTCLIEILEGGDASAKVNQLLVQATTPLDENEQKDLAKHAALAWCENVRMKGKGGLWDDGKNSKAQAIGERIYHEAYKKDWYSYSAAGRTKGISSYQFRSPAEWFAELYAAFHLKILPEAHPDYDWVSKLDPAPKKSKK